MWIFLGIYVLQVYFHALRASLLKVSGWSCVVYCTCIVYNKIIKLKILIYNQSIKIKIQIYE